MTKMKRLILILTIVFPFLVTAQTLTQGQSVLVYSLPKTEFVIHVDVELITEKPGTFYQYSERFLATSDVITAEKKYYQLKGISIEPRTVRDMERTYQIIPSKKSIANYISVNDDGVLCGINVEPVNLVKESRGGLTEYAKETERKKLLPLNEEYMFAGSTAKMAEGAAKQIYRIRENRVDLLSGDVDNMPTDGASLKAVLNEMDAQEKELTELFTGTTTVKPLTQTVIYSPVSAEKDKVVFRFSSLQGVVDSEDLSGVPYYLNISYNPIKTITPEKSKKKKDVEVFTVIPVTANVKFDDGDKILYEDKITLPQLGELVPIPFGTMDRYSKVYVSPETGRLLSVENLRKK